MLMLVLVLFLLERECTEGETPEGDIACGLGRGAIGVARGWLRFGSGQRNSLARLRHTIQSGEKVNTTGSGELVVGETLEDESEESEACSMLDFAAISLTGWTASTLAVEEEPK
jgi:hypothetical protein